MRIMVIACTSTDEMNMIKLSDLAEATGCEAYHCKGEKSYLLSPDGIVEGRPAS